MLSRLISLLSRIPAVKWAFDLLRPPPHSGSIEVAPGVADELPTIVAEAAPALDSVNTEPTPRAPDIEAATPVAEDDTAIPVIELAPSAAAADISIDEDSSLETAAEVEPLLVEETSFPSVEVAGEPLDTLEVVGSDPPAERLTEAEAEDVNEAPSVEVEAVEPPEPIVSSDTSPECAEDVEPIGAEQVIAAAEADTERAASPECVVEDEAGSAASVAIETVAVDVAAVNVVDAEITVPLPAEVSVDSEPAPNVAAKIEPPPASAPKSPSEPKARAKIAEPADRATLIRLRWAETGIRMWNPRLHGTGEATLNIQGRIELLPPAPGETMPRYDKLEFKMLGGQIVCEGVIVEAPVHASQRSFTRLAEPRSADRTREPVRERQAALA